jgi:predicted P-loop ATPase
MTGDLHAKDTAIGLQGKWFIEVSEMDALSRNEMTLVKAFLTRMSDDYRAPYGTVSEEHPRRTIFVGTSNNRTPLTDATGNRRFLMLTVGSFIDREALIRDRDQLFAEAWYRLQKGEKWELDSREYEMAVAAQADRLSVDHIMSLVVRSALGLWIQKKSFDLHDILMTVFKLTTGADATPIQALRVKKCLHAVGFLESRGRWILGVVDSNKRAIALAAGVDMAKILKEAGHAPLFDGPNQRTDDLVEDSSEDSDTATEEPLDFY